MVLLTAAGTNPSQSRRRTCQSRVLRQGPPGPPGSTRPSRVHSRKVLTSENFLRNSKAQKAGGEDEREQLL